MHSVREQTADYRQANAINHVDVTPPSDAADKTDRVRATSSDASGGTSQFTAAVSIEGKRVVFEIDTAALVSVVGEHTYRSQLSEFPLRSTGFFSQVVQWGGDY